MQLDDETLVAYVDGELDPKLCQAVETALRDDPTARAKERIFRESAAMLRAAYDRVVEEPVPERLRAVLEGSASQGKAASPRDSRPRRPILGGALKPVLALAASVALLIGLAGGYLLSGAGPVSEDGRFAGLWPDWIAAAHVDLQRALETAASYEPLMGSGGEPAVTWNVAAVSTFRAPTGRYCREFELAATSGGAAHGALGVACRTQEGDWRIELLMADSATTAPSGETETSDDEYAPAETSATDAFGVLVEGLMSGEPLDTEAEAALIGRAWQ